MDLLNKSLLLLLLLLLLLYTIVALDFRIYVYHTIQDM